MKILFYSPHPTLYFNAPTGYGSHMRGMVQGFREEGHSIEILVIGKKPEATATIVNSTSTKAFLKNVMPKIIWRTLKEIQQIRFDKHAAQELKRAVQTFAPDIVYERSAWMSNGSVEVLKYFKIKHIVEINAPFKEEVKKFEKAPSLIAHIGKKKLKNLLQSATLVAPITTSLEKYLIENYDIDKKKCLVVPNAIDLREIQIKDSRVEEIRNSFDLTTKKVIGFVGSIFPYHGVDRLIRSVSELKNINIVVLIVGDGYLIPELKKIANELGISSRVHFTGSVPKEDIYNYISAMDIVTLPNTEWYCSPVKLFEYGALGKRILAVNEAGVADIMSYEDGELFENNDNAFQEALIKTFAEFDVLAEKARGFQQKIVTNHTWKSNAAGVLLEINRNK
jgi:glycosyltransferase involved in cell wall biosynthesis